MGEEKETRKIIDRKKLRGEMVKIGMNTQDLGDFLGVSRQAAYLKLEEKREFSETEVALLRSKFGNKIFS